MIRRGPIFYGWVVVAVTAIVVMVTAGVRSAPGAFILSMTTEPGWSTASVSFAAAAGLVVFGLSGPLSGWLISRLGVRTVVLLSLVPFLAPFMMLSRISDGAVQPWEVLLSIAVLVATLGAALWIAARIYRAGVLLYGQRPGVLAVWRLMRSGV